MSNHLHIPGNMFYHCKDDSVVVQCGRCEYQEAIAFWQMTPAKGWRKTGWNLLTDSIRLFLLARNPPKFMLVWEGGYRSQFLQAQTLKEAKKEARSYTAPLTERCIVKLFRVHEDDVSHILSGQDLGLKESIRY